MGKTWYDSLQINATQRFWNGLAVTANYTYSKNLDFLGAPDIYNRSIGKTFSANDQPHQARISAQYTLPEFKNSSISALRNPFVAWTISGWGLGALLQYQSALAISRPNSATALPINNWLGRGGNTATAQLKLDANGQPMSPYAVNWTDYDGNVHAEPLDINCHCYDPTKTQVLNPNAWVSVPNGQWANDYSVLRDFRQIRYPSEAINVSRNFRIKEGINLNIRVEFQNAFNRTRLPQPTSGGAFGGVAYTAPVTNANGLINGGYGTIVPISGTAGQRTGLFIGRLTF
jgi:hypothetical protein